MRLSMRIIYEVMYYIFTGIKKWHTTEINAFVNAGDVLHFYN